MAHGRTTLSDVATAASVSKAVVSRVLNDAPGVSPQTRERVRRVIDALGYRPDPVARALASGHGDVVELVVVDHATTFGTNSYYSRVTAGMVQATVSSNAQLRVHVVEPDRAPALLSRIADTISVGVLLVNVEPELAGRLYERCDRVVSMGRSADGVPSTDPENTEGAQAAVEHLVSTGRRRIAAIHGKPGIACAQHRREGYRRGVRDAGLTEIAAQGTFSRESGYEKTRQLLAEHPAMDALFASCDLTASGALQALAEAGRKVPDDVAVVGFDDSPLAVCTTPPLTSVHQPVEQMAAAATSALVNRQVAPYWRAVFPTTLKVRASS
ncbi:LacI family DNA-binding transcriptional regulator [Actinoplanes sp. N902-109]|uniref:LacI family DNA-binding transcriptional regulator n=1 Tax=Actinoplanes sp. (strain N902-109) TaxID=649831 RepID=UPI0003293DA6|nr:LacI family DNA-binding transcriptional regulator [Actinoplanes sp. N902-109]AGL18194.1 LacI family transcriptional regulator [Actinoplanes sp. N902-109]